MRTRLAPAALAATLLLPVPWVPAYADGVCVSRLPMFVPDGITYTEGNTRRGQPCQIGLGQQGGTVQVLRITMRPLHGVLGLSAQEANRRYIAYAPSAGFAGRDRFEVYLQVLRPERALPIKTRIRVDMNVGP